MLQQQRPLTSVATVAKVDEVATAETIYQLKLRDYITRSTLIRPPTLTLDLLLWAEILRQGGRHVHAHIIGNGGGDDVKHMGGLEGIQLWLQDWVHGQDVDKGNVCEIIGACLCLVECQTLGIQSPVVFLALRN